MAVATSTVIVTEVYFEILVGGLFVLENLITVPHLAAISFFP